ncbi:MAG: Rid family hydrolase [Geminicoccaceae bacterium]
MRADRSRVDTGSVWEEKCGYARAVRIGNRILVSGTTASHGSDTVIARGDVESQAVHVLDRIQASIEALGGRIEDVVRTRILMKDAGRWEEASRAHGRVFSAIRPANTLVEVADLVGDYEIEIEAEAEIGPVMTSVG